MLQQSVLSIFINPIIFTWPYCLESWSEKYHAEASRSYETLEHACGLCAGDANDFQRSDAIMNIKRAINVRLKLLDKLYNFSEAVSLKKMGSLERLEAVGLAKPFIIKELFELRNDIEHNDASPPPLKRTKELLDITWYFLRATDAAVRSHSRTLIFEHPENDDESSGLWITAEILATNPSRISVRGWLAPPFVSHNSGAQLILEPVKKSRTKLELDSDQRRYVAGEIVGDCDVLVQLWNRMFNDWE